MCIINQLVIIIIHLQCKSAIFIKLLEISYFYFRASITRIISCNCSCRRLYSHNPNTHLDYTIRSSRRKMLLWKCRQQQETTFGHREVSFILLFMTHFCLVVFGITEKGDFKIVKYIMSSLTFTTVTRQMLNLLIVVT